ncbi:MAG: DUF420 domain-containing protein [Chitinophagales bacterium]|jgi:putative membrane protein|nr:DUF420 domain-containing protein [Chitinophagales bacterium]
MNQPTNFFANNEQLWAKIIVIVSILVPVLVTLLFYVQPPQMANSFDFSVLPPFHAFLNGSVAVLLVLSFYFIKNKNVQAHKICNLTALVLSATFLVSYVTYHTFTESTKFGGEGAIRYIYYFLLLTHIVLAAIILPIILFTFLYAFANKFEQHRKIARWTFPLWLYVSVTGVIVYLMISPYYQH